MKRITNRSRLKNKTAKSREVKNIKKFKANKPCFLSKQKSQKRFLKKVTFK